MKKIRNLPPLSSNQGEDYDLTSKQDLELEFEQEVDQFIDTLNTDKRPIESSDPNVAELQYLARKIKGQRVIPEPEITFSQNLYRKLETKTLTQPAAHTKANTKLKPDMRRKTLLPWTVLAASFLAIFILFNPWSKSDKNILIAMEQTVKQLQNYHGVLEKVSSNAEGETNVIQRMEIWSEGNKYATVNEDGKISVNNGERRWSIQPRNKQLTLLPIYLDPHDFDIQKEAAKALQYPNSIVGEDIVAGRSATRIQISPPGGLPYDLWIDTETHLPIKLQTAMQKSIQTTYTFTILETNIKINPSTFSFTPLDGYELIDLRPDKPFSSLEEAVAVSGLTPFQFSGLSEKPARFFASSNRVVFDFGDTIIIQTKASTPFFLSHLASLGQAEGSPLEILPDSLRWQQKDLEIKVQGQRAEEIAKRIVSDIVIPQANQASPNQPSVNIKIDMEIVKNNQQQVDAGSSPWQLDPVQVAFTFIALQISPDGINGEPPINYDFLKVESNNGSEAIIQISEGPIKTVYVKRLIRQDNSGIWTVVGYNPR